MAKTFIKIAQTTLVSSYENINFGSIPQTYTHLLLLSSARTNSGSGYYSNGFIRLNNTTTTYYGAALEGSNGTPSVFIDSGSSVNGIRCDFTAPGSASANNFNVSETWIHNYAGAAHKSGHQEIFVPNQTSNATFIDKRGWHWTGTAPVTSINVTTGGSGQFVAGTTWTLYGIGQLGSTNTGIATVAVS
jgi:hypothetical protein